VLAQANFGRKSRKFEEIKATPENGDCVRNRGKSAPETKEKQRRRKVVTEWTNYYKVVG
jgi:hypothetical protein